MSPLSYQDDEARYAFENSFVVRMRDWQIGGRGNPLTVDKDGTAVLIYFFATYMSVIFCDIRICAQAFESGFGVSVDINPTKDFEYP
jgi:hypothetical protein